MWSFHQESEALFKWEAFSLCYSLEFGFETQCAQLKLPSGCTPQTREVIFLWWSWPAFLGGKAEIGFRNTSYAKHVTCSFTVYKCSTVFSKTSVTGIETHAREFWWVYALKGCFFPVLFALHLAEWGSNLSVIKGRLSCFVPCIFWNAKYWLTLLEIINACHQQEGQGNFNWTNKFTHVKFLHVRIVFWQSSELIVYPIRGHNQY